MSALDAIKRAPRWTWYIAGGVGLGTVAIKLYQHRDAEDPSVTTGNGATAADGAPGTVVPATTGSSPPGIIVPPIITGGDGGSMSDLGASFAALLGGTITDLTGLAGRSIDAQAAANQQWIGAFQDSNSSWVGQFTGAFGDANAHWIQALANAGSAPQPVAQNPTPVVVNVAAPPAPAIAVPAPPAAPSAPAAPAARKPPNPEYPYYQEIGTRAGHWYKIVLKDGKRYKYYDNGDKVLA